MMLVDLNLNKTKMIRTANVQISL